MLGSHEPSCLFSLPPYIMANAKCPHTLSGNCIHPDCPTPSTHTPAPWRIGTATDNNNLLIQQDGDRPETRQVIAEIDPLPNKQANARLIAAAPELFEALEYVLEICKLDNMDWDALENNAVPMMEKAIAKARGE